MVDAPVQSTSDLFGDDEDFGLNERAEAVPAENRAHADRAESIDLYGDVADADGDKYAALYGSTENGGAPPPATTNRSASHHAASTSSAGDGAAGDASQQQGAAAMPAQQRAPAPAAAPSAAAPPAVYTNSAAVYIGNLQWWTTDAEVEALCAPHGAIERIRFFEEKPNGKSKGYALVAFDSARAAYLCKQGLDGTEINGKKCVVTFAKGAKQQAGPAPPAAAPSQGPVGRVVPFQGGRGQDFGGRGGGRGMGDISAGPPFQRPQQQQQFTAGKAGQMGWGPRPGMGGPFMPPGMVPPGPMMGGPMPGMPFMPPGFPPGMGMGGMPYGPNMMNGYGEPGFKRPRY